MTKASAKKPNILFIFSDQHRHDVMGCAGHPLVKTPNLDAIAARGVRFSRAWCQSPICQPSRASLITGRHPYDLNLFYNDAASSTTEVRGGGEEAVEIDPEWPTVMKQLQKAGYDTASIGKTHYHGLPTPDEVRAAGGSYDFRNYNPLVESFGWDHVVEEFDKYVHVRRAFRTPYSDYLEGLGLADAYRDQIKSVFRLTPTHWQGLTSAIPQEHDLTSFLADQAMDWLKGRKSDKPFLLNLAFVQPHVPLIDDPDWADYYKDADIEVPDLTLPEKTTPEWAWYVDQLGRHSQIDQNSDDFVREGIRHYLGMISLIDQKIGEVLDCLRAQGELDNTWIVYACDHGEMLGEHGLWAKMNFYHPSVQSPLLIAPPQPIEGRVSDRPSELTDITATLAAIGGVDAPEGCRGHSLLPELTGGSAESHDLIYSRIQSYAAACDGRYRLTMEMTSGEVCEFFDLSDDPNERDNLVNDPARQALVKEMSAALIDLQNS
jgi:arylsulfatase A-like enzyme